MISLLLLILLLAIGLVAGLLAGLLGIGGGLVIVPALTWLLLSQGFATELAVPVAVATSLSTMLMTAASAVWFHQRRHAIDWACFRRLAPALAVGAGFGAWFAASMDGVLLARIFAVVAALVGVRLLLAASVRASQREARPRGWWLAGPLIGAVSAMIGIGGGTFNVPWLARNGYSMVQAVAIASACGWPIAAAGTLLFMINAPAEPLAAALGHVWIAGMIVIGLGGMIAAPAGVALAHYLPAAQLRRLFGAILILIAIRMAW